MKPYILATLLCVVLAPILGATIIGTLSGNPIIIFWPAVLFASFLAAGTQALLFGATGSFLIFLRIKHNKPIKGLHIVACGFVFGLISALLPFLLCIENGRELFNTGVFALLLTGSIVGVVCSWLAYQVIQATKKRSGEPAA